MEISGCSSANEMKTAFNVVTLVEMARLLKVPQKTVYYWVNRREIPFTKVGRHLRFDPEEVIHYFKQRTQALSQETSKDAIFSRARSRSLKNW